ncbi:hypothetical protein DIS24_g6603 [Lasiodiplodia hormozganensis]|uniref:Uncharacterized protein n=1 Tax=Lasiodiplodia hormozganensis TaxID=869390 RepID=A0AA39YDJ3_9PEZI|nr:hypothetical protein DIS24_g6603 [Lasiodiplodia hormozganensis]
MFREANAPPPHLFPLVSSIWLSGITSRYVVNSILDTGNPHLLEHLHLDNLQEFAELENIPQDIPRAAKARMRASGQHHPDPDPDQTTTPTAIAGPMRTHLAPFIGKWTHLRSLHISTASQSSDVDHSRYYYRMHIDRHWPSAATEDARYAEIAHLLRSVAGTLRLFRFEHGPTGNLAADGWAMAPARRFMQSSCTSPPSARPPPSRVRPMDARFARFLVPAIVGSAWPMLERMELVGVAARSRYDNDRPVIPYEDCEYWPAMVNTPLDEGTQAALRWAVGEKAVLVVRESAEGWFWIAENGRHGHGIPEVVEGEGEGE